MKILERVDIVEKYDHIINNSIGLGSTKTCNNFKGMGSNFRLARKLVYSHKNTAMMKNIRAERSIGRICIVL